LRGELNRCQRVFDLVSHSPGNLPPRGCSLRPLQLREILEDQRHTHLPPLIVTDRGDGHEDGHRLFPKRQIELLFDEPFRTLPHLAEDLVRQKTVFGNQHLFIRPV